MFTRGTTAPRYQRALIATTMILCVIIYLRGLFGSFLFDDFPNIVDKPELRALDGSLFRWLALAVSSNAGILRRPISMLSFGLDYRLFGLNPFAFKLTNLAIHLGNGLLLFSLAYKLAPKLIGKTHDDRQTAASARALALLVTACWLLHPLNVSTVIYVVQRMDELAAMFTLSGLLCYISGRERMLRGEHGLLIATSGICVFGLLAVLSKENGALIVAYALVIEACCYRFAAPHLTQRHSLRIFHVLTTVVPVALFLAYITIHPQWLLNGYAGRHFTLNQRVLSEARILCDYLLWIFVPLPHWMGVYHDDLATSTSLLLPITTLPAILFLLALAVLAWRLRRRHPGVTFAVAWFLIGHSMESTILPLELAFDHRNYLPMTGLLLGLCCATVPLLQEWARPRIIITCSTTLVLALACTTASWAYAWGNPLRLALTEVANHPNSSRACYEAGRQIIFQGTTNGQRYAAELRAVPYFERGKQLDPTDIYSAASLIIIRGKHGNLPPEAITDLAYRVKHMRQLQINPFLVVLTAATTGGIRLSPDEMKLLVESSLDNTRLSATMRAMILNDYGHYMFQVVHNNQFAVSLTVAAAAEDPTNPLFQINLTRLAMALNDNEEAHQHLQRAEELDKAKMYFTTLANLKRQLSTAHTPIQADNDSSL